jgi:hypothetical protein
MGDMEVTVQQEIDAPLKAAPHVVLLGAGASKAALPNGDRNGRPMPLLRDVASELDLAGQFPEDLRDLAVTNFEAAYSRLYERDAELTASIDEQVREDFAQLELPDEPTIYDALLLSLRDKDAVFTFNWDPLLFQSILRLIRAGVPGTALPTTWFLHGNVAVGHCDEHPQVRNVPGTLCKYCGGPLMASRLLFPVEHKDYQDGSMIEREWAAAQSYLRHAFWFTIFGYSAPVTDVEAKQLLKGAWGEVEDRRMEQTEIINRPGADHDELRETWDPFIHTHHYEIHESFHESWIANHPRRTLEAYVHQYIDAKFIENNPVPTDFATIEELVAWFEPLFQAERRYMDSIKAVVSEDTPPS